MNWNRMRQRMMIRILQQNRQHLHPRRLRLAAAILQGSLQGPFTVGRVLARLRLGIGVPGQMELEVPQQAARARNEEGYGQGQKLPALDKAVRGRVALAVNDGRGGWSLRKRLDQRNGQRLVRD